MSKKSDAIRAQIAALEVKLAEAINAEANEISVEKLTAGTQVTFDYGRGETRTVKQGTVLGVKLPVEGQKGAALVRIQIGEGFDAEIVTVYPANVRSLVATGEGVAAAE
jgi:hypothetical protein